MPVVVRLRPVGPGRAEIVDQETLRQNAARPYGFAPRPRPIPPSVALFEGEVGGLTAEEARARLAALASSAVQPHYPDAAVHVEWLEGGG